MASLADFGVPGSGSGILHPLMAYRWRIMFPGAELITAQATKIELDLINCSFTLYAEQPAINAEKFLHQITKIGARKSAGSTRFSIDFLDGSDGVLSQIEGYTKMLSHQFVLDYANTGVATHVMKFEYNPGSANIQ